MKKWQIMLLTLALVAVMMLTLAGCNFIQQIKDRLGGSPGTIDVPEVLEQLATPVLRLEDDDLMWSEIEGADQYVVSYTDDQSRTGTITTSINYCDLSTITTYGTYTLQVKARNTQAKFADSALSNSCVWEHKQIVALEATPFACFVGTTRLAVVCDPIEGVATYKVRLGESVYSATYPCVWVEADAEEAQDMVFFVEGDTSHNFGEATIDVAYQPEQSQHFAIESYDKADSTCALSSLQSLDQSVTSITLDGISFADSYSGSLSITKLRGYEVGDHCLVATYGDSRLYILLIIGDTRPLAFVSTGGTPITSMDYDLGVSDLIIDILPYANTVTQIALDGATIAQSDYVVYPAALVVKDEALSGLAEGDHTLTVSYQTSTGAAQSADITVHCIAVFDLTYDKASGTSLSCMSLPADSSLVLGGNLAYGRYYISKGTDSATVTLNSSYLSTLDAGTYTYLVIPDKSAVVPFNVTVYDSGCAPKDVCIDYDTDPSVAYVRFGCDCGATRHSYKLDSAGYVDTDAFAVPLNALNRRGSHSVTVKCATNNTTSSTFVIDTSSDDAYAFTRTHFDFDGKHPDLFIASQAEFNTLLHYLAYGGFYNANEGDFGTSSTDIYIGAGVLSDTYTLQTLLSTANGSFRSPTAAGIDLRDPTNPNSNSVSINSDYSCRISVNYVFGSPLAKTATTGMVARDSTDTRELLIEHNDHTPYIVGLSNTQSISNLAQLSILPYGVRPVFEGDDESTLRAKTAYETALGVCSTYISGDMSLFQKVQTIYDYLCLNVTYNDYALVWYDLNAYAQYVAEEDDALSLLRSRIDSYTAQSRYSDMTDLATVRAMDFDTATAYLAEIMSNSAFDLYGALVDKTAVCDGISDALRLMCVIENIPCIKVTGMAQSGTGDTENHAWNKVQIDGDWYVVDATWGRSTDSNHTFDTVTHQYCLVSDVHVFINHYENGNSLSDTSMQYVAIAPDYDYYTATTVYGRDLSIDDWNDFETTVKNLYAHKESMPYVELRFAFDTNESTARSHIESIRVGLQSINVSYIFNRNHLQLWFK